jgi:hypothetical protein
MMVVVKLQCSLLPVPMTVVVTVLANRMFALGYYQ